MNTEIEVAAPAIGIIETESNEQYHGTEAVSASKLRVFKRKPGGPQLYYQHFIAKSIPREETEAMAVGTALHCAVLEPQKFEATVAVKPSGIDRRTTLGKAAYQAFIDGAQGKTIISADDLVMIRSIAQGIHSHRSASKLLANGKAELSWRIEAAGLAHCPPLQCRTDWFCAAGCDLTDGRPYVLDIKSTATLERSAFGNFHRACQDHAYHHQAALYMAILAALGYECRDFFFVAAEKVAPYGVEVYRLSDRSLAKGQRDVERLLLELNECYQRNEWPNTEGGVQELDVKTAWGVSEEDL
jgi:hypothetical protein